MAVPSKVDFLLPTAARSWLQQTPNGVTAAVIRDAGAGVVVPAGDPAALLDTAVQLVSCV